VRRFSVSYDESLGRSADLKQSAQLTGKSLGFELQPQTNSAQRLAKCLQIVHFESQLLDLEGKSVKITPAESVVRMDRG
jgi:hypothetical protein